MKYIRNQAMGFLNIDDKNLAVFDNESEDTHYIDATGKAILDILKFETAEGNLICQLCELYSATEKEIAADVQKFLKKLILKKVVICL